MGGFLTDLQRQMSEMPTSTDLPYLVRNFLLKYSIMVRLDFVTGGFFKFTEKYSYIIIALHFLIKSGIPG